MKVLDVDLLHDGLTRNINKMNQLEKEMTAIQQAVEKLIAMEDALKGEGGQAIRNFYTSCHLPFLQYFLMFKEEFNTVLQQAQQALVSLEPVDAGHIVEEFLETGVEKGLTESATITATLTDEANAIMDEVSDIVSLPKLNDTLVQESVMDARAKRDDTIEALHTFDSTQTNQLVPIESSIQSMKEWVQHIEGLFQEGLTDVNFPTDKWSSIAGNSAIVMSLSAMGVETGIESQAPLACELPVETDVKGDKAWYKVVGDVLVGITEGVAKAVTDIFTGLYDMLKNLFTDPIGFFGGLATAIMNPIDTASQMWGAVEVAWERDVVNGDARSRAEFFSYATVSIFGLKGVDKLGKVGKATSKADTTLPYNALKTDKLKDTVKANVYATVQQKTEQASDFWKSNFSKEAINKTIEATKNSAIMTKAKNTLESINMKTAVAKTYQDVVKTPIAKTQAAWEKKKDQLLDMPLPNFGLSPVPLGPTANMTVREGIEAAQNTVMQIVVNKDGGGERAEDTGNVHRYEIDEVIKNDYDKNGNLINRSIVPKGYESVEDFLKVVDDTTIKEFGYDSVEEFKVVVGHVDDYLNASPKNNIVNKGLAGGKHVKGVDYDVLGFPIFKGDDVKFTYKLDEELFIARDLKQFKECTKALKKEIDAGIITKDIFTPKQLQQIVDEAPYIDDLTWHHHQVPGKMQLVISSKHSVNHLGGNKLWGGGIR